MPSTPTYPHGTVVLLVGTKRGLFRLTSRDRASWEVAQLGLEPRRVYNAVLDQRSSPRIFAADNDDFFGSYIRYSDDFGETWKEPRQGIKFPEDSGLTLKNIWIVEPGRADDPQTLYAGVDPASLWVSTDGGDTWDANPGLANHPHARALESRERRSLPAHDCSGSNQPLTYVGRHLGGWLLRTDDGGQTWTIATSICARASNPTCTRNMASAPSDGPAPAPSPISLPAESLWDLSRARTRATIGPTSAAVSPRTSASPWRWTPTIPRRCTPSSRPTGAITSVTSSPSTAPMMAVIAGTRSPRASLAGLAFASASCAMVCARMRSIPLACMLAPTPASSSPAATAVTPGS